MKIHIFPVSIVILIMLSILSIAAGCSRGSVSVSSQEIQPSEDTTAYFYEDIEFYSIVGDEYLTMSQELYEFLSESQYYDCGAVVMLEDSTGAYTPEAYLWESDEETGLDLQVETPCIVLVNNTEASRDFYIGALADGIPQKLTLGGDLAYTQLVTVSSKSAVILPFQVELSQVLDREEHFFSMMLIQDGGVLSSTIDNVMPFGVQRLYVENTGTIPCETDSRATVERGTYKAESNQFYLDAALTDAVSATASGPNIASGENGQTLYYYRNFADEDVEYVTFVLWDDIPLQNADLPVVYYWSCHEASLYLPVTLEDMENTSHTITVVTVQVAVEGDTGTAMQSFFKLSSRILAEGA